MEAQCGSSEQPKPGPKIPRITRLMALAIKLQQMIERVEIQDYVDISRLGYVTRARASQIMNLTLLAPDIQEALLFLQESAGGTSPTEHDMRKIAKIAIWAEQRRLLGRDLDNSSRQPQV